MRIMSWNIERFGINKVCPNRWDKTGRRRVHIERILQEAAPDVLVVQEVQTSPAEGFGGLISDPSGGTGVRVMRLILRNVSNLPAGVEWKLVPPVILTPLGGYSEGIAVFFKSPTLRFEGPMAWTANGIKPPGGQGANAPIPYPAPWTNMLPATPSGIGPNQNCLAGQYEFLQGNQQRWKFPDDNSRSLWRTRFLNTATNRYLNLFSLHFPPAPRNAKRAFKVLSRVSEIRAELQPNEDRVILGDLNINVSAPQDRAVFGYLTNAARVSRRIPPCRIRYVLQFGAGSMTMLRPVGDASTEGQPQFYEYAQLSRFGVLQGLDNAFVARGGQGIAAANNQDVVNTIVGVPLGAPARFRVDMAEGIPVINANIPIQGAPRSQRFNTLVNFGHIGARRGASDHLPIVFDLP